MDSEEVKITLNITSRLLNQDRMTKIFETIEKAIHDELSKMDKDTIPIFLKMEIATLDQI